MKKHFGIVLVVLLLPAVAQAAVFGISATLQTAYIAKIKNGVPKLQVNAAPAGFVKSTDAKRKFSFMYPDSWEKTVPANTDSELLMEFKMRYDDAGVAAQTVVRVSKSNSYTQQSYNDYIKTLLASYGAKKDGEEYSLTYETFAGAKNVMHLRSTNSKESPSYADTYSIIKNGYIYAISYQSVDENYALDLPVVKKVLASFKVN